MKSRKLILLSLGFSSALLAEGEEVSCQAICCEGYRPNYYMETCGYHTTAEFSYFYARESEIALADKQKNVQVGEYIDSELVLESIVIDRQPQNFSYLPVNWNAGFQLGVGTSSLCSGFQLDLNWSFYQNNSEKCITVPYELNVPIDNVTAGKVQLNTSWLPFLNFGSELLTEWNFRLNRLDLQASHRYSLSPCFTLMPHFGISGFWSDTKLKFQILNLTTQGDDELMIQDGLKQKNCIWGAGFFGGLQSHYFLFTGFSIYSDFGFSLFWGQERYKDEKIVRRDQISGTTGTFLVQSGNLKGKLNHFGMQTVFHISLGISQASEFCCGKYTSEFQIGWEHQIWYSLNERYFYYSSGTLMPSSGDLMMGGLVLRARLGF